MTSIHKDLQTAINSLISLNNTRRNSRIKETWVKLFIASKDRLTNCISKCLSNDLQSSDCSVKKQAITRFTYPTVGAFSRRLTKSARPTCVVVAVMEGNFPNRVLLARNTKHEVVISPLRHKCSRKTIPSDLRTVRPALS